MFPTVPIPRIVILDPAPGAPPYFVMVTPATLPCNAFTALDDGVFAKSSPFTEETEPVRSLFSEYHNRQQQPHQVLSFLILIQRLSCYQ